MACGEVYGLNDGANYIFTNETHQYGFISTSQSHMSNCKIYVTTRWRIQGDLGVKPPHEIVLAIYILYTFYITNIYYN